MEEFLRNKDPRASAQDPYFVEIPPFLIYLEGFLIKINMFIFTKCSIKQLHNTETY